MSPTSDEPLVIVPARRGSKRLPAKNRASVGALSLVERTLEHARRSGLSDIAVTSDDPWVLDKARLHGAVAIERPAELATDETTSEQVIAHVLDAIPGQMMRQIVLAQPTTPFRTRATFESCLRLSDRYRHALVTTVAATSKPDSWLFGLEDSGLLSRLGDIPPVRLLTGGLYVFFAEDFMRTRSFVNMERFGVEVDQHHSIDIDVPLDLALARAVVALGLGDDLIDEEGGSR